MSGPVVRTEKNTNGSNSTAPVRGNNKKRREPLQTKDGVVLEALRSAKRSGKLPSVDLIDYATASLHPELAKLVTSSWFKSVAAAVYDRIVAGVFNQLSRDEVSRKSPQSPLPPNPLLPVKLPQSPAKIPNPTPKSVPRDTTQLYTMRGQATVGVNRRNAVALSGPRSPTTRITNTEMVGTRGVDSTGNFAASILYNERINPANAVLFPWLSRIARNYEKYRFSKLVLRCVSNNPTTAGGYVAMGVDKDSADPVPYSKQELMNMGRAKSEALWSGATLPIIVDGTWKFVDSQNLSADARQVDVGKLVAVATSPGFANATLDFYLDYSVEFTLPSASYSGLQVMSSKTGFSSLYDKPLGSTVWATQDSQGYWVFNKTGNYLISGSFTGSGFTGAGMQADGDVTTIYKSNAETASTAALSWAVTVPAIGKKFRYRHTGATFDFARLTIIPLGDSETARSIEV